MKTNMLNTDRTIRFLVAFAFAILYFTHLTPASIGIGLLVVSVAFWITSYTGFSPLYWLFGHRENKHR